MIADAYIHSLNQFSTVILPILLMTLIKSILLFAIVVLLIRALNIASVRTKYVLWVCYMFSIVLIAIYTTVSPAFNIPFLQISPHRVKENIVLSNLLFPQNEALSTANKYTSKYSVYLQEELNLSSESLHWTFWVLCGWTIGTLCSLLHALTGRIGVAGISKNASKYGESHFKDEISQLARELGITRKVNVVESCRCRLPFTYNFVHPVLVIPYEAKDWPVKKRRTILIHELSHIRRLDYLIITLSRLICSVFCFIPVTWIAHAYMQLEQEMICDSVTIEEGERPTVYARYMIDLARTARSLVLWSGIFMMKRRNNMLEKRVANVLDMTRSKIHERASLIRSSFLPIIVLVVAIVLIAGSCATGKKALSEDDFLKSYSGTWMNPDSSGVDFDFQKLVVEYDGTWETYANDIVEQRSCSGSITFIDSWTDSAGVMWYRAYKDFDFLCGSDRQYEYGKISNSGNTLEFLYRLGTGEIKKWDPDNPHYGYRILYRL
jgi:beta-lactamase regulating signal transducer with metallopeptidase domain